MIGEWFKEEGLSPSIDLGNFSVGVATALIAAVSFFVALRTGRSTSNLKIAEFRQAWIERLRSAVALFLGTCSETANHAVTHHEGKERARELDQSNSRLKEIEAQIRLLLNVAEQDHRLLLNVVKQMRGRAAALSVELEYRVSLELDDLGLLAGDVTALILKSEWARVNDDTYGRLQISRRLRRKRLEISLRDLRAMVRKRAAKFAPILD